MQEGATPTPPHNPGPSHMRTRGNRSHTATNILDPNCTRARGCHSHASTQSGPLSHVHKRPQLPRRNPTFWSPAVRVQEGATPTPPHNPGPSHTRTRGNRSHTASQHTGPQLHTCKRVPLPRLHTIRAPFTRAQEATVPRQNPTFWAPAVRGQEGATPTPPHNPGPSHTRTRGNRSHTASQHTGPQLNTCKKAPLPRLHTIRAPLTRAQEATAPTPQPNILVPCCMRARGRHSHASTQSGPLSHVHRRPQLPCRSHATSPHSGTLLYACKRVPLPRLHTIRAPLTRAQEATVPTPQPHILGPFCTRARGCHSHASTQSGPLSHAHKRKPLPHRQPTYWTPTAHVSHAAATPQVHILGPYCTHGRGCHSHASTQSGPLSHAHKRKPLPHRHEHTGPKLHTCKRVPLPRLHTIRAPLTRAHEATVPTPQPHILDPNCTRARGCHSHASTQSGPLSHVHKRPQLPRRNPTFWSPAVRVQEGATPTPPHNPGPSHTRTRGNRSHTASQHTGPQLHTCKRVPLPRLHTIRAPFTRAQEATVPRQNPTFWAPAVRGQEGATPTPPHNPGPSHTRTRGNRSHTATQHTGPQLHTCKRVPLPRLHTIRAPLTRAQEATAPTPLPRHKSTFWAPTVRMEEGATPTPPHNPGPSHMRTRGNRSHTATNILDPNCTRARGCHSHASTQSGPLSHVHMRPQFPRHSPTF
ncbi:unnamed protein product [Oreochromis niloticus]|nr:unnamed protein product [Mustela putorius furo]